MHQVQERLWTACLEVRVIPTLDLFYDKMLIGCNSCLPRIFIFFLGLNAPFHISDFYNYIIVMSRSELSIKFHYNTEVYRLVGFNFNWIQFYFEALIYLFFKKYSKSRRHSFLYIHRGGAERKWNRVNVIKSFLIKGGDTL